MSAKHSTNWAIILTLIGEIFLWDLFQGSVCPVNFVSWKYTFTDWGFVLLTIQNTSNPETFDHDVIALTKRKGSKCSWVLDLLLLNEGYSAAGVYANIQILRNSGTWNISDSKHCIKGVKGISCFYVDILSSGIDTES